VKIGKGIGKSREREIPKTRLANLAISVLFKSAPEKFVRRIMKKAKETIFIPNDQACAYRNQFRGWHEIVGIDVHTVRFDGESMLEFGRFKGPFCESDPFQGPHGDVGIFFMLGQNAI
jgi:hypothetical protein